MLQRKSSCLRLRVPAGDSNVHACMSTAKPFGWICGIRWLHFAQAQAFRERLLETLIERGLLSPCFQYATLLPWRKCLLGSVLDRKGCHYGIGCSGGRFIVGPVDSVIDISQVLLRNAQRASDDLAGTVAVIHPGAVKLSPLAP